MNLAGPGAEVESSKLEALIYRFQKRRKCNPNKKRIAQFMPISVNSNLSFEKLITFSSRHIFSSSKVQTIHLFFYLFQVLRLVNKLKA